MKALKSIKRPYAVKDAAILINSLTFTDMASMGDVTSMHDIIKYLRSTGEIPTPA
jgi:hypothetical protein